MDLFERVNTGVDISEYFRQAVPGSEIKIIGDVSRLVPCPFPGCGSAKGCTIYPATNSFKCFACSAAGDVTKAAALLNGQSNGDAARGLAEQFGISADGPDPPPSPARPPLRIVKKADERSEWVDSDRAFEVREFAARMFERSFWLSDWAMDRQLKKRGHFEQTLKDERVGFTSGALIHQAEEAGYAVEDLIGIGLVRVRGRGVQETIPARCFVYPHLAEDGRVRYFSWKDPHKNKEWAVKKAFATAGWICLGQDAIGAESIIIVEGEDDRLSVMDAGYPNCIATNGNFNTSNILKWLQENADGKVFWLAFDADQAGRKYVDKFTAAIIEGRGVVHQMTLPEGMDIDDVIRQHEDPAGKRSALEGLMETSKECRMEDSGKGGGGGFSCEFENFDVLGELAGGEIVFWCKQKQCNYEVQLKDLTLDKLHQIGGREIAAKVCRTVKEAEEEPDKLLFTTVKRSLIIQAGDNRLPRLEKMGQGIHKLDDEAGKILVVNGGYAWVWDGRSFTRQEYPLIQKKTLILFEPGQEWVNMGEVQTQIRDMTAEKGRATIRALHEIYEQWGFRGRYDSRLLTGWVLAQIVQTIWDWRPHLWVTGSSSTGKTLLNLTNAALLGELMLPCQGSKLTEAGFRQSIADLALAPYIDEFEKCDHRTRIIELLRMAGRTGIARLGSVKGEAIAYSIKHMVFVSSIEKGLERSAENSRFLTIETKKDDFRRPKQPARAKARALRHQMIAYAIWASARAKALIASIEGQLSDRIDDSLAVPFAMLKVCSKEPDKQLDLLNAIERYHEEWDRFYGGTLVEDEVALMQMILDSKLKLPKRQMTLEDQERIVHLDVSVSQAVFVDDPYEYADGMAGIVEANGIKKIMEAEVVFFQPSNIERYLLKGTRWEGIKTKELLNRIPGSKWERNYIAGSRPYGVSIPIDWFFDMELL